MINLLPPQRQAELAFARRNRVAIGYFKLVTLAFMVLAGIFGGALWQLNKVTANARAIADSTGTTLAKSAQFKAEALDASKRLAAIKTLQQSQTRFSTLISDISKVLPSGVAIQAITLTGDDTKPVRISVSGPTYSSILALRDGLAQSPRISAVDVESISEDEGGFVGQVVFGFKKGQAK